MLPDLPAPSPSPILRIAPSTANDLLECSLRVGFARDESFGGWRRPTASSTLGVAAHRVLELAFRSSAVPPAERPQAIRDEWARAIADGESELAKAWAPASPPPPDQWPGYQLVKVKTIRRADRIAASRPARPAKANEGGGIETWMSSPRLKLEGRADRIEATGHGLRVIDVKSGLHQDDPTDGQVRQLMLYAALVHETQGVWPTEIAVETTSGQQHLMVLDPGDAEAAVQDAQQGIDRFNRLIDQDQLLAAAEPNENRCRFCAFKIACRPYWSALRAEWPHHAVLGEVTSAAEGSSSAALTINLVAPIDAEHPRIRVSGVSVAQHPVDPRWFAGVDLKRVQGRDDLAARWSSRIRVW